MARVFSKAFSQTMAQVNAGYKDNRLFLTPACGRPGSLVSNSCCYCILLPTLIRKLFGWWSHTVSNTPPVLTLRTGPAEPRRRAGRSSSTKLLHGLLASSLSKSPSEGEQDLLHSNRNSFTQQHCVKHFLNTRKK